MSWKNALKQSQFALPVLIPGVTHFQEKCIERGREVSFDLQGYMDPIELKWKATVVDTATGTTAVQDGFASKDTAMKHAMDSLFQKLEENGSLTGATPVIIPVQSIQSSSPPPYQGGPQLYDLMNKVAAIIPDRWREVGVQLGVPVRVLDSFWKQRATDNMDCFKDVFAYWKERCTKPYCWLTIIEVLKSPAVGEIELAQNLQAVYCI